MLIRSSERAQEYYLDTTGRVSFYSTELSPDQAIVLTQNLREMDCELVVRSIMVLGLGKVMEVYEDVIKTFGVYLEAVNEDVVLEFEQHVLTRYPRLRECQSLREELMKVPDGSRDRTPGGVFFRLIRAAW